MALLEYKVKDFGRPRIESLKLKMFGSTAYVSKLPFKSSPFRVSCNISSTQDTQGGSRDSWKYQGMKETLGCGIRMSRLHIPSQNALHIKKHEAFMDANDFIYWCSRNISSTPDNPAIRVLPDDIVAAAMSSKPDNTAIVSGAMGSKPYNAAVAIFGAGTEVKWCFFNISSTQDHADIDRDSAAVYRGKGKPVQKYWCPGGGPDLIVDDATLPIHLGVKAEEEFAKTGKSPDPESTTNLEVQKFLGLIKESIKVDPLRYHGMKERLVGVSGETTTVVKRLNQMQDSRTLPFPAINVNDPFTKIKLNDLNGCRASFLDGLMRATDAMIAVKVAVGCGYGDVGKPFCVVQPLMEALPEDVFGTAVIFVKNNAIVCNIGYFDHNFYMQDFEIFPVVEKITIKPQMDKWVFPDTNSGIIVLAEGRVMNLGCATGHPSFVMSFSFTKQAAYINVPAEGPYNTGH